jgi:hypothetical protein
MPQKMMEAREVAYSRATSRNVSASIPQTSAIFSGEKPTMFAFSASKFSV